MLNKFILCIASGISVSAIINYLIEFMEWLRNEPRNMRNLTDIIVKTAIFTGFLCYVAIVGNVSC